MALRLVDTPWSYSALDAFETCPLNFYWTRVHKPSRGEPYSKAKADGTDVHSAMQAYVERGTEPPIALRKFKGIVDRVTTDASDVVCEIKLGLTAELKPCGYFDHNISLRTQFDLQALRPDAIAQLDYKTSSQPRETELQLKLYGLAGLMTWTQYDKAWSAYIYTHHPSRALLTERKDLPAIVAEVNPRVERLRLAREENHWPERQGWKCSYCPVKECRFWKPTPQKR
jgi:RecB family exonuclease